MIFYIASKSTFATDLVRCLLWIRGLQFWFCPGPQKTQGRPWPWPPGQGRPCSVGRRGSRPRPPNRWGPQSYMYAVYYIWRSKPWYVLAQQKLQAINPTASNQPMDTEARPSSILPNEAMPAWCLFSCSPSETKETRDANWSPLRP